MDWPTATLLSILIISIATCTAIVDWSITSRYDVQIECVKQTQDRYCSK